MAKKAETFDFINEKQEAKWTHKQNEIKTTKIKTHIEN